MCPPFRADSAASHSQYDAALPVALGAPGYVREHEGMSSDGDPDCPGPRGSDPSGTPFAQLDPTSLRAQRSSQKWSRYPADVLPLFVAEMDYTVAPEIRSALAERVAASDFGYLDGQAQSPLAPVFADFARDRWGWDVAPGRVHLATDVSAGVVEVLRLVLADRAGRGTATGTRGRVALATPAYPSFFEMLEELGVEIVEVPLAVSDSADGPTATLDLAAVEASFAGGTGVDAFLLCNPHNPHGLAHAAETLAALAALAARHDVFVLSDEIHAPLVHRGVAFTPFAPVAEAAGARSVTATSASKGWNLAGTKCSLVIAATAADAALLDELPPEVGSRASILGVHASIAAFRDARAWLDRAVETVEANVALLRELVTDRLPGVRVTVTRAGYLAWLDLRDAGLGEDPHARILAEARVALSNGRAFGAGGAGHVRINLACAPDTLRTAIDRIAALPPVREGATE